MASGPIGSLLPGECFNCGHGRQVPPDQCFECGGLFGCAAHPGRCRQCNDKIIAQLFFVAYVEPTTWPSLPPEPTNNPLGYPSGTSTATNGGPQTTITIQPLRLSG